jgi:hypothetical protein
MFIEFVVKVTCSDCMSSIINTLVSELFYFHNTVQLLVSSAYLKTINLRLARSYHKWSLCTNWQVGTLVYSEHVSLLQWYENISRDIAWFPAETTKWRMFCYLQIFLKSRGSVCDVMAPRMRNWMICMWVWWWQKSVSALEIFFIITLSRCFLRYVTTLRC